MHHIRIENAWAKVNLSLKVLARLDTGYHQLSSLVCFATLHDRLVFHFQDSSEHPADCYQVMPPRLELHGPFATPLLNIESNNLVLKAHTAFFEAMRSGQIKSGPISCAKISKISLEKNIPPGAGLGGGSADAAATLRVLAHTHGVALTDKYLQIIAGKLGADVPVCLYSMARWMEGTGEELGPPLHLPECNLLLVFPGTSLSTADVFRKLEPAQAVTDMDQRSKTDMSGKQQLHFKDDFLSLLHFLKGQSNDLYRPAHKILPSLFDITRQLEQLDGCHLVRMSGSGSAFFGLFTDRKKCNAAAEEISRRHANWHVWPCEILQNPDNKANNTTK